MSRAPRGRSDSSAGMSSSFKRPFNVLSDQSNSQCISKYFKGAKANPKPSEFDATTSKRLQAKYDNFSNQPIHIPEKIPFPKFGSKVVNESSQNNYAQQITAQDFNAPSNKIQKRVLTNADEKCLKTPTKTIRSSTIHLIGCVENALSWYEKLKNADVYVIYNVIGRFISVENGKHNLEKYVSVRGVYDRRVLECSYFEVDCSLPSMTEGQLVACLGHMTGKQKFNLYHIYAMNNTTNLDVQRAISLSQRMVSEYSDSKSR